MSTNYVVYAQTIINDEAIALGPFLPLKNEDQFILVPLLDNSSWFRDSFDFINDKVSYTCGLPSKLCDELYKLFSFEENSFYKSKEDYYSQCLYCYKFSDISPLLKKDKPYKYNGYISKETKASFECGEIEEINGWYSIEEYRSMNNEEKKEYVYYEWNNSGDAYSGVVELVNNVYALIEAWNNYYGTDWSFNESREAVENIQILILVVN